MEARERFTIYEHVVVHFVALNEKLSKDLIEASFGARNGIVDLVSFIVINMFVYDWDALRFDAPFEAYIFWITRIVTHLLMITVTVTISNVCWIKRWPLLTVLLSRIVDYDISRVTRSEIDFYVSQFYIEGAITFCNNTMS